VLGAALEGSLLGYGGGNGAVGGTLSVTMDSHGSKVGNPPGSPFVNVTIPDGFWPQVEDTFIVLQPTVGDSQIQPGAATTADLLDGKIPLSTAMITSGGFGSLTLNTPGASMGPTAAVTFSATDNVSLTLPGQLTINSANIVVPSMRTDVLSANYFLWQQAVNESQTPGALLGANETSSLTITANTVDLVGSLAVEGAKTTSFDVAGDLRLTALVASSAPDFVPVGSLVSSSDLVFTAGQIYPSTGTNYTLSSETSVSFFANGAPPATPLSAGGVLNVLAPTINQYGTLRAPMGTINFGATAGSQTASGSGGDANGVGNWTFFTETQNFAIGQSVTLTSDDGQVTLSGIVLSFNLGQETMSIAVTSASGPASSHQGANWNIVGAENSNITLGQGSLTSVSAGGQIIPFGTTNNAASISANTTWNYSVQPGGVNAIAQPPAKLVSINGSSVTVAPGATIDESGGGDLYASEFVPGTGGSMNIFAGQNRNIAQAANVYAVLPGYDGIAPYDPNITGGTPSIGRQVYLNGVPGLAAGFYTLLPSQYGQLPGAFLITMQTMPSASTAALTRAALPSSIALPDGSAVTSGYVVSAGTGATDEHWSVFQVMSSAVSHQYSQIVNSFASTFFPALAGVSGSAVPRLPQDAGQLAIAATTSLTFQGTGVFNPAPGGLGGLADISGNQILVVDTSTRNRSGRCRTDARHANLQRSFPGCGGYLCPGWFGGRHDRPGRLEPARSVRERSQRSRG
jgi:hypothetical protein